MFSRSVDVMAHCLKKDINATEEELAHLQELLDARENILGGSNARTMSYRQPSLVLDDFLYHGDLGHASNKKLLTELGIKHIVNVCDCPLDESMEKSFRVLWINVDDVLKVNMRRHFEKTNEFLYECKQKNEKVLVNCQMGISRSSTIVLAYLMKYHHDSLMKAYGYLLERRCCAAPNLSFFVQLIRYEKELLATKEIDESKHNDDQQNPLVELETTQDSTASSNKGDETTTEAYE